jgi:hypothetical protein
VNFVKADVSPLWPYPRLEYKIFLTQKLRENYCLITFDSYFKPKEKIISLEEHGMHKKEKVSITSFHINCSLDSFIKLSGVLFEEKDVERWVSASAAFIRKSDLEKLGISKGGSYTLIAFNDMVSKKISPYTSPSEDILIVKIGPFYIDSFWDFMYTWIDLQPKIYKDNFNNMNLKEIVATFLKTKKNIVSPKEIEHLYKDLNMENVITFADIKNKIVLIKFSTEKDKEINMNIIKKKPLYDFLNEFVEVNYVADLDIKNNYVTLTKIKEAYIELTEQQPTSSQSLLLNLWLKIKCFFLRLIGKAC